jgi:uncharacterized membrane protein YedE/YeeE
MKELLTQPWPWYVSGPLIGFMVPLLLIAGNKPFGISSSMRHICAMCVPVKIKFFDYDWKKEIWSLVYVAGILFGGFLAGYIFRNPEPVQLNEKTILDLNSMGLTDLSGLVPAQIFNLSALLTLKGFIMMVLGGFCVGFGTRYANGCTSGHTITGLSALSFSSLVATVCFFVGGLAMAWFILPHILSL